MTHDTLILPGSLAWNFAVQDLPPPPGWGETAAKTNGEMALIGLPGEHGLLQAVTMDRYWEYIHDGEADDRQDEINQADGVIWI